MTWGVLHPVAIHSDSGLSAKDSRGRELFFPKIFFCSSLTRLSCSRFIRWRSSSIKRCSSTMANRSSAYETQHERKLWLKLNSRTQRSHLMAMGLNCDCDGSLTSFFWASSIFLSFSSMIRFNSSRARRSSSWKRWKHWIRDWTREKYGK